MAGSEEGERAASHGRAQFDDRPEWNSGRESAQSIYDSTSHVPKQAENPPAERPGQSRAEKPVIG